MPRPPFLTRFSWILFPVIIATILFAWITQIVIELQPRTFRDTFTIILLALSVVTVFVLVIMKDEKDWIYRKVAIPSTAVLIMFMIYGITTLLKDHCEKCDEEEKETKGYVSDDIDAYFERIRNNESLLTAFFSAMPKGGDLHNHMSGSVYAESYIDGAIQNNWWVQPKTLELSATWIRGYKQLTRFKGDDLFALKQRLVREWSLKDFYDGFRPNDDHFFTAFRKWPDNHPSARTLEELCKRAKHEKVQYLELMTGAPRPEVKFLKRQDIDKKIRHANAVADDSLQSVFQFLLDTIQPLIPAAAAKKETGIRNALSTTTAVPVTFICGVNRKEPLLDVFRSVATSFYLCNTSDLFVGVNILSREDGDTSMMDYSLHMKMFKFFKKKYPNVKCSLHAGELTLGTVTPENLGDHIYQAVFVAGANRIGHGVDIAYESECYKILAYMREKKIPVEINISSNEFILKVKGNRHPLPLYFEHGVPIVISTDDAGILRTNLTEQYVLLALRYPQVKYADIKQIIKNSIEYSFIKEQRVKEKIMNKLDTDIQEIEKMILSQHQNQRQ